LPRVNLFASVTGLFLSAPLLFAQGSGGSISGHVTNSVTGAGIEGAKVQAACTPDNACFPGKPSQRGVTDSAGAFRLAGIPDGRYALLAQKDGLLQKRSSDSEFMLSVSGDARFDVQLTPFAKLSGRVVDPEGKPVAGLRVQLEQGERRDTIILAGEYDKVSPKVTNQDGAFVFENVHPGIYTLLAQVKPRAEGKDGERTVTTYYPSVVYPEQASSIQVQGVDLFGYEIRLRTAPARTIRGIVLDPEGKPASQVSVKLLAKAASSSCLDAGNGNRAPADRDALGQH
jgi:5-hydroxyisourate hydrolase-like protein (transthyretin family)